MNGPDDQLREWQQPDSEDGGLVSGTTIEGVNETEAEADHPEESLLRQAGAEDVDDYVLPEAAPESTFLNTTQLEREDIRRLIHLLIRRQKGIRLYRIGIAAFGFFFIAYGVLSLVRFLNDANRANLLSGGLVALLGCGALYLAARGIVNMTTRRVMKSADRFLYQRRYRFTPEGIEYQPSGHEPLAVPWSDVSEWTWDDRNFYLLVRGSWFLIAQSGFRGAGGGQFASLVEQQGIPSSPAGHHRPGR